MTEFEIFQAMLDLELDTREEQERFIEQKCGSDVAMKESLFSMLDAHHQCGDFLEEPLRVPPSKSSSSTILVEGEAHVVDYNLDDTEMMSGKSSHPVNYEDYMDPSDRKDLLGIIPGYEIKDVLGQGGMGIVFRAEQPKLKRTVAIKMMKREFAAKTATRKRFLKEAQAAASINNPHSVTIHAVGVHKVPYFVMECIEGQSLEKKLEQEGTLGELEVLRIASQIAKGLAATHEQGLVHRDVKPANILLENGVERAKLVDFGVVCALEEARMTVEGELVGTVAYMSPEQTQSRNIDYRSDLFSLGSVIYTMCTGHSPFRSKNVLAAANRINNDSPRPIEQSNSEISQDLRSIIFRLLEKNPENRYQSANEVADDLLKLMQIRDPVNPPQQNPSEASPKKFPRIWYLIACLSIFAFLGAGELTGKTKVIPTVIKLVKGEATLVVEVNDPNIGISLNGEEIVLSGIGPHQIRITPGKYHLQARKDGRPIYSEMITLSRNGHKQVSIGWEPIGSDIVDKPPISEGKQVNENTGTEHHQDKPIGTVMLQGVSNFRDIASLADLKQFEKDNVVSIKITSGLTLTDVDMKDFENLSGLENLDFPEGNVTGEGLRSLKSLTSLKTLSIRGMQWTDETIQHLAPLENLEYLTLTGPALTEKGFRHLSGLTNLQTLALPGQIRVTDEMVQHLAPLVKMTHLQITGPVTNEGIRSLQGMKKLVAFTGSDLAITDGTDVFVSMPLVVWRVSGSSINDEGLRKLCECRSIVQLGLRNCPNITDAGVQAIQELSHLTELFLTDVNITDESVKHFVVHDLKSLNLSGTRITDASMPAIARHTNLQHLELMSTSISDAGLTHLSDLKALDALRLNHTGIGDSGVRHLGSLSLLRGLDLQGTKITDTSLEMLSEMKSLKQLLVGGTNVSDEGVAAFRKRRPDCHLTTVFNPAGKRPDKPE